MNKLHLALLNYLPVVGFAIYAILTGFKNDLFLPLLLTGWLVVVIYQTILTAIYTPPKIPLLGILLLLLTPLLLLAQSLIQNLDASVVFIEMACIDLMGCIIGLIVAFIRKLKQEGSKNAPLFAIIFTIACVATGGFFLGRLLYRFLEMQNFNWITILLIAFGLVRSLIFFTERMNKLTDGIGSSAKKEFSAGAILISLAIWLLGVPLMMWVASFFMVYQ